MPTEPAPGTAGAPANPNPTAPASAAPVPGGTPSRPKPGNIHTHRSQRVDMGKQGRPLLEWTLYVVALGALVVVLAGPIIAQSVRGDSWIISSIILGIFGFALLKNFSDVAFIARQRKLTNQQIDQLRETNNIFVFLQNSEPSLFRDHIDNLHEIFRRDYNLSQDNLVTLLQARLLAKTKVVDFASSILVTLGLVGTIIGLIQSADGLTDVFMAMSHNDTSIMSGVESTLEGMGIAFYTTLLGAILGGVCLRLLSNLVDSNIEHVVSHIAELTEIYILPILRRAGRINEEHQRKLRERGIGLPPGVPVPGSVPDTRAADSNAPMPPPGGTIDPSGETMA
ncbi:MAG: MotA/TolQ/ExbB proton channel family protein [Phycisphaerales bacterium JB063]